MDKKKMPMNKKKQKAAGDNQPQPEKKQEGGKDG